MKNIINGLKIGVAVLAAFIVIVSINGGSTTSATLTYPIFHKGMSYVTWSHDGFSDTASDLSIKAMSKIGVKCVAIVPTWYQEKYNSTEIKITDRTPSDDGIRRAIRKAHEEGMFVMLKPHVDLTSDEDNCRSDIGFSADDKWSEWFASYQRFIVHYARIAQAENVEFFCVGTELSFAATKTEMWRDGIIPAVRKVFKGQITYAANWDEYANIKFWDLVDYAGIDAYFPLAEKAAPSYEEIKKGWKRWVADIETWAAHVKKPVIFTECGYASVNTAAIKPWQENRESRPNPDLQADCYKALMEELWEKQWFFGVYWWNWNTCPDSGGWSSRDFTPQNKPASLYIKEWYQKNIEKNFIITEEDTYPKSR